MNDVKSLAHSKWECKYHVVWIPKYRKKQLYGGVAKYLGSIFHELARERESQIVEGHLCPDHIHMLIEIPPKYAVAQVIGYIKEKSAITIARRFVGRQKNFSGQNFWARRYYVSTAGRDEATIRKYIKEQEAEDHRLDQLEIFKDK
ncbi:MAG: IS200/IS605 family transposase [Treponema sp.]|jgi:putative transposase|nr:IS200/IS605 family transposase [Treponema sp.]